ncbi:MAG: LysR family transcriptional regulator [Oligoflexia bacterium]|nr:LysR family transcriptional regulator [Oligoflexia bacterium]
MDFQNLQTFCAVISEGSMTAAASKLSITQPAVSQQIRQLEKDFGVKLLSRNARKVKPTVQGQIFYETSNRILNLIQNARNSIRALSLNLSGEKINVSTINSIGLHLVSPVISNFLKLNNEMKLSLLYGTGESVVQRMQKAELDLVIMPDLRKEYGRDFPYFQKSLLFKDTLCFVGPGKDQNLPKTMLFKDISRLRLIQVENHYLAFQNVFQKEMRKRDLSFETSFQCDNIGTVKRAIESGLGCGFLPAHSIHKQLRLGRLKLIEIEDFNYSVNIYFYLKPDEKKNRIVEILKLLILQQAQAIS